MRPDLYNLLYGALALLLVSALVTPFFARKRRLAGWINFLVSGAASLLLLPVVGKLVVGGASPGATTLGLGPLSIHLLLDPLAGLFIGLVAVVGALSALYSIRYMEHSRDYGLAGFYAAFPLFLFGMISVLVVDDLTVGFTIAWQIMTVASYFLVRFEHRKPGIRRSANQYLALMELAWAAIIGAVVVIGGTGPGDSLHEITLVIGRSEPGMVWIAFGLLLVGFGMKAGVFPLGQLWLPDAHSVAPSPISALLSGVMLKTGIYGLIRTLFWMAPAADTSRFDGAIWGGILGMIGLCTLFIGTVQSMKQSDSKRLLAYSSIGQIGYIVFGMGAALLLLDSSDQAARLLGMVALLGVGYHVLNHAIFKALLFLSSGSVIYATGTQDLNRLGGLIRWMPMTAVLAGVGSLAIAGVPPFSGFASKWTIVSASLMAGQGQVFLILGGVVALFTSAITLACYVKFFGMTFTSAGTEWTVGHPVREVPGLMLIPKIVLGTLCLVQGLFPLQFYRVLAGVLQRSDESSIQAAFQGLDVPSLGHLGLSGIWIPVANGGGETTGFGTTPLLLLALLAVALVFGWWLRQSAGSAARDVPTWLCGYQELNNNNRYLDRSLYSALKNALRWTGGNPD